MWSRGSAGESESDLRLVAQRKANYARLSPVELHRIEEVVLPNTLDAVTGEPIVTSRMAYVEIAEDVEGADLLGPRTGGAQSDSKVLSGVRFLLDALADGDWHDSAGLKVLARPHGLSGRTLQRAALDELALSTSGEAPFDDALASPQSRRGFTQ